MVKICGMSMLHEMLPQSPNSGQSNPAEPVHSFRTVNISFGGFSQKLHCTISRTDFGLSVYLLGNSFRRHSLLFHMNLRFLSPHRHSAYFMSRSMYSCHMHLCSLPSIGWFQAYLMCIMSVCLKGRAHAFAAVSQTLSC